MALEKKIIVDQIEVTADNMVQVRTRTSILEDGVELSSAFHRHVIAPGKCTEVEDQKVQSICNVVHTPEVIASYTSLIANSAGE